MAFFSIIQKYVWLTIIILGLGLSGVFLPRLYDGYVDVVQAGDGSSIDTPITICDSGCDYTTINDAFSAGGASKYYEVQAGFTSFSDSFITDVPTSSYFTCASNDIVVISSSTAQIEWGMSEGATLTGCSFNNVNIGQNKPEGIYQPATGVTISDNIFTTTSPSFIYGSVSTTNWTVSGNIGLNGFNITPKCNNCTISGNTIHITSSTDTSGIKISGDSINILSNTIQGYVSDGGAYGSVIESDSGLSNTLIATNTISFPTPVVTTSYNFNAIHMYSSSGMDSSVTSTIIRGNRIIVRYDDSQTLGNSSEAAVNVIDISATSTGQIAVEISHNTIVCDPHCTNAISFGGWSSPDSSAAVTSTYNIFYSAELFNSDGNTDTAVEFNSGISSPTVYEDYNVFYNFSTNLNYSNSSQTIGSNSLTSDPGLRLLDSNTFNDWMLAPYSNLFDVNGTVDIGADTGSRGSTFVIDADGTVDYSTIHATTTAALSSATSSDTWNIYGGVYDGFSLSSITGFTLAGQEDGVILSAGASSNPIRLSSVDNSTFSNLTVRNASSTSESFTVTINPYSLDGTDYDGDCDPCMEFVFADEGASESDMILSITENNQSVADVIDDTPQTWNLALLKVEEVDMGEPLTSYVTGYYDDNEFSNQAAVQTFWDDMYAGEDVTTTIMHWHEDLFVYTNGAYVYTAPTGPTLLEGFNSGTPEIARSLSYYNAGIYLSNSDTNTFSNVTSTASTYNVHFTGTSAGNNINDAVLANAISYDILADGSGDNNIKNTSFSTASTSITSTGDVNVYYKMRALVTTTSSGVEGMDVTFEDAGSNASSTLSTDSDGYTSYTDYLLAWVMDSTTTTDKTNGTYNPYTISAAATSTYAATSTAATLDSINETITLITGSAPTAPALSSGSIGATTSTIEWTDNADDETGFVWLISTDDETYTTATTTSANVTSASITGLTPNTVYYAKIAAFNTYGTSTYYSWGGDDDTTTNPAIPSSLATSADGTDSIILTWGANSNPATTVYDLRYDGDDYATSITTTIDRSYTMTGLSAGTTYTFKVRAQYLTSSTLYSNYSDTASATTDSAASEEVVSGGGGGSVAPAPPSAPSTASAPTVSVSVEPNTPQIVAIGNTSHTVTAAAPAADGSVVITIQSDPVTITLLPKEERLIDTNTDGENDLFVRLDSANEDIVQVTLSAIDDLEFSINRALSTTESQDVILHFNSPHAVMVAISNTADFEGVSYQSYMSEIPWTLTEGSGEKTVYVKLRTAQGGTRDVSDTIVRVVADVPSDVVIPEGECPLDVEKAYKHEKHSGVYYITDTCTKRAFMDESTFFSYFVSWDGVSVVAEEKLAMVPRDVLEFMPKGSLYIPLESSLVKTVTDPSVYLLFSGQKHLIASPTVFKALGYAWNWIEDVASSLLDKFSSGENISESGTHPNYTLITYPDSSEIYRIEPDQNDATKQVKRCIKNEEVFESYGFKWERVVEIDESETYADGAPLQ
ncbi:hypothetical protein C0581_03470 [Candidatus Parcubacteria bacterium]|nr:MAG: hypothetical protein C0581_03470 [Candidatus Parcubacteria bacterium]